MKKRPQIRDISLGRNNICILVTSKKLADKLRRDIEEEAPVVNWTRKFDRIRKLAPRRGTIGWGYRYAVEGHWERVTP